MKFENKWLNRLATFFMFVGMFYFAFMLYMLGPYLFHCLIGDECIPF